MLDGWVDGWNEASPQTSWELVSSLHPSVYPQYQKKKTIKLYVMFRYAKTRPSDCSRVFALNLQ